MQGKITLITPPDIYENRELGVLFIHLNEDDQDRVSKWLSTASVDQNLNFYVYNGEVDVGWLLWAAGCCTYKYIDLDNTNYISKAISGYLLSKNDFYYKVTDEN